MSSTEGPKEKKKEVRHRNHHLLRDVLPPLDEILPDIITKAVSIGQLLNEMLDCILPKTEKIWPRNRIGMLAIANSIGLLHNIRPSSCGRSGNDRLVRPI